MQRRLERKALFRAPACVSPDEGEIAGLFALEEAHDLRDMGFRMVSEVRQDLRIAAVGEGGDLAKNRVPSAASTLPAERRSAGATSGTTPLSTRRSSV